MQGDKKSSDMIKIQRHDKKFQRSFHENARARRKQVKSKIILSIFSYTVECIERNISIIERATVYIWFS